ncbi:exosortase-dependent surface protein XDP1 [Paucibacter sp. XJ19-41]|uniref:exosortase-dependent surface protein XDP1 n=1 Tax=Paucibacter sp. XJ19-41 TaxID=2927824 RepID=UPI00234AD1E1|nr:exosortase-dependent surface protein XDP1 [Paucibacter sp. XJ19-41]MDC6168250.1 PEP-CTERM sorting domain-containing protein [Paucibacter sp. XJ19-41]
MKTKHFAHAAGLLIGMSASVISGNAFALSTWNSQSCTASGSAHGNNYSCSANGITATVTAWSTTGSSSTYQDATVNLYSGGFGVRNRNPYDGSDTGTTPDEQQDPQHSIDNMTNTDLVLINFGADSVALKALSLGWWTSDSDVTVMRYKGGAVGNTSSLAGFGAGNLISNGWELVKSVADVGNLPNDSTTFNAAGVSSSWWLISAYNSTYGGSGTGLDTATKDYFKLLTFGGDKTSQTPGTGVPEPGSLALVGIAALGMMGLRRRAKTAK